MSIRLKISILLACFFSLILTNSVFIWLMEREASDKLSTIAHANQTLVRQQTLISALKDAETGQRGYLLTLDNSYLAPYHSGLQDIRRSFALLEENAGHDPQQRALLEKTKQLIQDKTSELNETLVLAQQGQLKEAIEVVRSGRGKRLMDDIRIALDTFATREQNYLNERLGDYRANKARLETLLAVEFLAALTLALLTWIYINRSLFIPLSNLIQGAEKIQAGQTLEASDIVQKDEMGRVLSTFYAMSNQIHEREQILKHQAQHDVLTGLKNRTTLQHEITENLQIARQNDCKIAVILVDLDNFKAVNDTYGHEAGDGVLIEVAKRLKSSIRSGDTAFRIGGDEFVILLNNLQSSTNALNVARNILSQCDKPIHTTTQLLPINLSLGISIGPDHSQHPETLLQQADTAMYQAKKSSGSALRVYSSENSHSLAKPKTESA